MIPAEDGFPAFDDSQRPTSDEHGRQIAPETFVRWIAPAAWVDTEGNLHHDIRAFHKWLGWEISPASIRETTEIFQALLAAHFAAHPENRPAKIIVRP